MNKNIILTLLMLFIIDSFALAQSKHINKAIEDEILRSVKGHQRAIDSITNQLILMVEDTSLNLDLRIDLIFLIGQLETDLGKFFLLQHISEEMPLEEIRGDGDMARMKPYFSTLLLKRSSQIEFGKFLNLIIKYLKTPIRNDKDYQYLISLLIQDFNGELLIVKNLLESEFKKLPPSSVEKYGYRAIYRSNLEKMLALLPAK